MSDIKPLGHGKERTKSLFVLPQDQLPDSPTGAESGLNRRDFLIAAGFALASAGVGGCRRAPVKEAIPLLFQTESLVPGVPSYYASTCGACNAGCGILVKNNDGRPTKLEGNPDHPLSKGGLCAVGQASLLGLYDRLRPRQPLKDGKEVSWDEIDAAIKAQLATIKQKGGAVRLLTGTITSPTTNGLIKRFLGAFGDSRHIVSDAVSCSAILDSHERTQGVRALPHYHFDRADLILSFDADFLGTWISPVEFTASYRARRQLRGKNPHVSRHIQVESRLSLTGTKADERICLAPAEIRALLFRIAVGLARQAQIQLAPAGLEWGNLSPPLEGICNRLMKDLWLARQRSLVLNGAQSVSDQVVCNFINHVLENYGSTLDIERPSNQRAGSDGELKKLLGELHDGKVNALFIVDSNPVADLPGGEQLAQALRRVPLVVCCTSQLDETARVARYVCPQPHYLESWNDAEPISGVVSLAQPTIRRFGNTRPLMESLASWSGKPGPAYELLRESWRTATFPRQTKWPSFQAFWDHAVHDGFAEVTPIQLKPKPFDVAQVQAALQEHHQSGAGLALILYPKVGMPDGSHAYNPWLQELPDPVTKVTWDNYASLSPRAAAKLGLSEGDLVRLEVPGPERDAAVLELPVYIQPGQHDGTIAVALGYGRLATERFAGIGPSWLDAKPAVGPNGRVGQNASSFLNWDGDTLGYTRSSIVLTKTSGKHILASTQGHYTLAVPDHLATPGTEYKPPVQEMTLAALKAQAGNAQSHGDRAPELWPADHPYPGHRWGMVIDLDACTGCSACVVACQSENNIPVVGKDEVSRRREIHWLRIDRYYSENDGTLDVAHQPMLCQHCERAPCETVCPVLATVHSSEGLNEQVYNRCVGTRYCANNCPYKVRRFNWFAYAHEDSLQNMALNPDVTVRSRGVMEKCTFCVQRIEQAKIDVKQRGIALRDGVLQTACQQSCPARAIVFGDMNDPTSEVAKLRKDPRHYHALAELNIGPAVGYLKVVRNRQDRERGPSHG
jgi:molybdopterin-containing oxidoreductase family iron-sulfur binding subunit